MFNLGSLLLIAQHIKMHTVGLSLIHLFSQSLAQTLAILVKEIGSMVTFVMANRLYSRVVEIT